MTKWTKKSIDEAYKRGRRDFSGEDFSGLDLRGVILIDADLSWANLEGANLRGADLYQADMTGAYLAGVDLTGANIDYSCWPIGCGSLNVKVDKRIASQLCYHFCALDCDDPEYQEARTKVLNFANLMHRTDVKRLD